MEAAREVRMNMAEEGRKSAELALSSETQRRQRFENEVKEMQQTIYGQQAKLDQARLVEEEKDRLARENKYLAQKHEDDLKSVRKEYDSRTHELLEKNRVLQQKSDRDKADLEVANSRMWEVEQKASKLERDSTNYTRELARQAEALEKEQARNAKLDSVNRALEEDAHQQRGDLRDLEREKATEAQARAAAERDLEDMTAARNELKENHRTVSDELRDVKHESSLKYGKLTSNLERKTKELDDAVTSYEKQLSEKNNALKGEAEALREANGTIDDLTKRVGDTEHDLHNAHKECDDLSDNLRDKIAELQVSATTVEDLRVKGQNKADILRRIVTVLDSMNLRSEDADGNYSAEMDVSLPEEFFTAENFDDIPDYLWGDALAWLQGKMNAFKRINRAFESTIDQCESKWVTQYHKLEEELDMREDEVQGLEKKLQELLAMMGHGKRFSEPASRRQSIARSRPISRASTATDRYAQRGDSTHNSPMRRDTQRSQHSNRDIEPRSGSMQPVTPIPKSRRESAQPVTTPTTTKPLAKHSSSPGGSRPASRQASRPISRQHSRKNSHTEYSMRPSSSMLGEEVEDSNNNAASTPSSRSSMRSQVPEDSTSSSGRRPSLRTSIQVISERRMPSESERRDSNLSTSSSRRDTTSSYTRGSPSNDNVVVRPPRN
jgi:hypothetical protein